jgi:hypothetical protein
VDGDLVFDAAEFIAGDAVGQSEGKARTRRIPHFSMTRRYARWTAIASATARVAPSRLNARSTKARDSSVG